MVLWTVVACVLLWILQALVIRFLVQIPIGALTATPYRRVLSRIPPASSDEEWAAEHPKTIHLAAFLWRFSMVSASVITYALLLAFLYWLSTFIATVSWWWVFGLSVLLFYYNLADAVRFNSRYSSLSYRLKGGTSEVRLRHDTPHLPPDDVLGPITPKSNSF